MKTLCIVTKDIDTSYTKKNISTGGDLSAIIPQGKCLWLERSAIEHDPNFKQLIAYAIVTDASGHIASYVRHGSETRLHGIWSCGVGGHVDPSDEGTTVLQTVKNGLLRELSEEFSDFRLENVLIRYCGIINEIESELGRCHFGIVFHVQLASGCIFHAAEELRGLQWFSYDEIRTKKTELWSQMALALVKGVNQK